MRRPWQAIIVARGSASAGKVQSILGRAQLYTATLLSVAALFPLNVQLESVPTVDPQFAMYRAAPPCTIR